MITGIAKMNNENICIPKNEILSTLKESLDALDNICCVAVFPEFCNKETLTACRQWLSDNNGSAAVWAKTAENLRDLIRKYEGDNDGQESKL